ncbi:MAG: bifunctional biotin--[acetyl-CoA-carboxylase] ligase/biotin operon repressor BirA [Gammaproteobacteria bacterium]|nr:bifunctional biotin--[acetyl-CoA-carboxylase] ligase/biotin operon repressor BirA [Gammaproteobacteria bacterium]
MHKAADILTILADGNFHSGQDLAEQLLLSRSGVWKSVQYLQSCGVDIFAVRGKGYRLSCPTELLDEALIQESIVKKMLPQLGGIEVLWQVDSTNRYLLQRALSGVESGYTCVAEMQTLGRGRRGRQWISPLGWNIYLSQLWRFSSGPAQLSGLSLATAIAVVRAIKVLDIKNVGVKWPNDVLINHKKVAGILLEINGEASGPSNVVAGVGVNVRLSDTALDKIDQPCTDLESHLKRPLQRNQFVVLLITELLSVYQEYREHGFVSFRDEWHEFDLYMGQQVRLSAGTGYIVGFNRGVDIHGALMLEHNEQVASFQSGEISMRAVPQTTSARKD